MTIGYDNIALHHSLCLNISMDEWSAGATYLTHDLSKVHHQFTVHGAAWGTIAASGQPYLHLDGGNDYLECPAADSADLNVTTEDLTLLMWINPDISGAAELLLNQGVVDVDGFEFFEFNTNLSFRLNQGGGHTDISAVACLTAGIWQLISVTRSGANGQFYVNGLPVATIGSGALVDAVSCAGANKLLVGIQNDETTNVYGGLIGGGLRGPRIWFGRALTVPEEARIFEYERHWFGV